MGARETRTKYRCADLSSFVNVDTHFSLGNVPAGEHVDANVSVSMQCGVIDVPGLNDTQDTNNADYATQDYHLSPNDVGNFTSTRNAADTVDISAGSYNDNPLPINENISLVGSSTQVYRGGGLEYG